MVQECEMICSDFKIQKSRFPSPSSSLWDPKDSENRGVSLRLPWTNPGSSTSNLWGLQETAFPVMGITLPKHSFQADVTYSPVQSFQPLPPVSFPEIKTGLAYVCVCGPIPGVIPACLLACMYTMTCSVWYAPRLFQFVSDGKLCCEVELRPQLAEVPHV